ncbi:MAG: dCTP deaminase [Methanomicrobiales archaeon]|nr:dCTP deaminase [Methanomicrobiales archaeon]
MILSARAIRDRLGDGGGLVLTPFAEECLQPASYDLRVGSDVILSPKECSLVPSMEWVELPADLAATLRCRSSYARRGLLIGGGFVDPGFRGQLTLCLTNMSAEPLRLRREERVVQMVLHQVTTNDRVYTGRYQDSEGAIPSRL